MAKLYGEGHDMSFHGEGKEFRTNDTKSLRMSDYDQDSGRVSYLAEHANNYVKHNKPNIEKVSPEKIRATQSWISSEAGGGGDPVVGDLTDRPVGVKHPSGEVHLLDGHHRVNAKASSKAKDKPAIEMYTVPWPKE